MCCPGHHDPVSHLGELPRGELTGRGWITKLLDPEGRRPALFVQNPDPQVMALNDHVLVAPMPGGGCWFWWPWASRIAPTGRRGDPGRRQGHPRSGLSRRRLIPWASPVSS